MGRLICLLVGHLEDKHSIKLEGGAGFDLLRVQPPPGESGYRVNPCKRCGVLFMILEEPREPPLTAEDVWKAMEEGIGRA